MPRIKIISIPEGPGIPEEVRKGWVGLEFEAEVPQSMHLSSVLTPNENYGEQMAYMVSRDVALQALKEKDEKAWQWFNRCSGLAPLFCFKVESCKEI